MVCLDLLFVQPNESEVRKTKKALDKYAIESLTLDSLSPAISATMLLEFLRDLPEPLISTQYKLFLNVLKSPSESNQINDIKLLVKQLPNPNKGTLIYILQVRSLEAFVTTSAHVQSPGP